MVNAKKSQVNIYFLRCDPRCFSRCFSLLILLNFPCAICVWTHRNIVGIFLPFKFSKCLHSISCASYSFKDTFATTTCNDFGCSEIVSVTINHPISASFPDFWHECSINLRRNLCATKCAPNKGSQNHKQNKYLFHSFLLLFSTNYEVIHFNALCQGIYRLNYSFI